MADSIARIALSRTTSPRSRTIEATEPSTSAAGNARRTDPITFEPGTLCLVVGGEDPYEAIADLEARVGEVRTSMGKSGLVPELPLGSESGDCLIVRVEDPSAILGWILRRCEEGFRVVVCTRAQSPGGAMRTLLGFRGPAGLRWLRAVSLAYLWEGQLSKMAADAVDH